MSRAIANAELRNRLTDAAKNRHYDAAGLLVHQIDTRLERGEHFRDRHGGLLLSLDQMIEAILHDNLVIDGG